MHNPIRPKSYSDRSGYSYNKETTKEQEARFWLRNYHSALITFIVALPFNLFYLLSTLDGPNRKALLILSGIVFLVTLVLALLPAQKISHQPWRMRFFHAWTLSSLLLVFLIICLDGGPSSPTLLFIYLVLLFACQTYTAKSTFIYTLILTLALAAVMAFHPDSTGLLGENLFLLGIVALSGGLAVSIAHIRQTQERERSNLRQRLADLASRDLMTGCLNNTSFNERLSQEIARAHRERATLSVLLIDVDYFKDINDKYGHQEGNNALCAISQTIKEVARASDVAGRLGGDEFAILAPSTNSQEAKKLANRLRENIRQLSASYNLTLSIGICVADCQHHWHHFELLDTADRALYSVKAKGRNGVAVLCLNHPEDLKSH